MVLDSPLIILSRRPSPVRLLLSSIYCLRPKLLVTEMDVIYLLVMFHVILSVTFMCQISLALVSIFSLEYE